MAIYLNTTDFNFSSTGTGKAYIRIVGSTACYAGNEKNRTNKRRDKMNVYKIYLVDKVNCEIVLEKTTIADSEANALLGVVLTDEQTKKFKRDEYEFVITPQGEFEKIKYTRTINISDEE